MISNTKENINISMNRDLQTGHTWEAVNKHGMFSIGLALCNIFGYGPLENLLKE